MNINEDIQENISKAKELALKQRERDKGKRLVKVGHNLCAWSARRNTNNLKW